MNEKKKQGFAALSPERVREIGRWRGVRSACDVGRYERSHLADIIGCLFNRTTNGETGPASNRS